MAKIRFSPKLLPSTAAIRAAPASDRLLVQPLRHKRNGRHSAQFAQIVGGPRSAPQQRRRDTVVLAERRWQTAESRAAHQVSAVAAGARPYAEHHVQATPAALDRRGLESAHQRRNELAPAAAERRRRCRPDAAAASVRQDRLPAGAYREVDGWTVFESRRLALLMGTRYSVRGNNTIILY